MSSLGLHVTYNATNQPLHGWSGGDGWLVGCLAASALGSKEEAPREVSAANLLSIRTFVGTLSGINAQLLETPFHILAMLLAYNYLKL